MSDRSVSFLRIESMQQQHRAKIRGEACQMCFSFQIENMD